MNYVQDLIEKKGDKQITFIVHYSYISTADVETFSKVETHIAIDCETCRKEMFYNFEQFKLHVREENVSKYARDNIGFLHKSKLLYNRVLNDDLSYKEFPKLETDIMDQLFKDFAMGEYFVKGFVVSYGFKLSLLYDKKELDFML